MARLLLHGLSPGTNYKVQVRATNGGIVSDWSSLLTFLTVGDTMPPATPTGLAWNVVGTSFSGTWVAPTTNQDGSPLKDLRDYKVIVTATVGGASQTFYVTETNFNLTFEQNVAAFGQPRASVQISVQARDITGNLSTPAVTSTAVNPPPAQPANLTATGQNEQIAIRWDAVADTDLDHYEVYASTSSAGFTPGAGNLFFKGLATAYTLPTYASYVPWYIKVCAVDVFQSQSTFASATATPTSSFVVDTTPPAQPTGLAVSGVTDPQDPTNTRVIATVTWTQTSVADLAGFTIRYRKTGDTNWYTYDVSDGSLRAATITGLSSGQGYDFQIKSYDFSGNTIGFTATATLASVADTTAPAQVAGLVLTPSQNSITAAWTENSEADVKNGAGTYEVQIDTANTFSTGNLKTYKTGANSITIAGLATATTYYVRVRAIDASTNPGTYSTTGSTATTSFPVTAVSDGSAPASSPAAIVTPGIGNLSVSWNPVTAGTLPGDLVKYEVHISTTNTFTPTQGGATRVATALGTNVTLENDAAGAALAYGTTYYVRIIAGDADGWAAPGAVGSGTPAKAGSTDITTVGGNQVKDGVAPASSPAVNISAGIGYLFAYWTAVANNDPVTYEVHLSTSTGFTPSGATKVFETTDTSAFIRTLPGSSTPLSYGTTYFVRLIAKDLDGSAAAGTQGSGVPVKAINTDITLSATDVGAVDTTTFNNAIAGKNKVTYSTAAPGSTANTAGDVWFQYDNTSTNIIAQFQGNGGTSWTQRSLDSQVIASLAVGKLTAGTLSAITITVPSTGAIQSSDYVAGTTGFKLTSGGLEIRTGTVSANTLTAGTISGQTIQVAATGSVQSTDFVSGSAGWKLSTTGLEIRSGVVNANTIVSGTGIVNNLVVNSGGAVQSSNYSLNSAGFKLSNTGLEINNGTVKASTLTSGTISAQTITVAGASGSGASLIVDQYGEIRSNNWAAGSTGFRLFGGGAGAASLEINAGSIKTEAFAGGTFSASKLITLGDASTDGTIQSFGYATGSSGWRINKSGIEIVNGTISARTLQLQVGGNLLPVQYADFENQSTYYTPSVFVTANSPTLTVSATAKFNTQSLSIAAGGSAPTVDFTTGATTYNIPIENTTTYIVSAYVQHNNGSAQNIAFRFKDDVTAVATSANISVPTGTAWTRVSATFTSAASATAAWVGLSLPASVTWLVDGVQFEKQTGAFTTPASWRPPSTTIIDGGMIKTGSIQSTSLVSTGQSSGTQPQWVINTGGSATFANALIRGHLIVGDSSNGGSLTDQYIASNYVAGSSGYILKGNGNVEFNNGTFRGTIVVQSGSGSSIDGGAIAGTVGNASTAGTATNSSNLTGGNISGTNYVTGGIRTTASTARVEINGSGMFAYNSSGTPTVSINSDGSATFSGSLSGASINGATGTFSGALSATSGTIGGWQISASSGLVDASNNLRLLANGNIELHTGGAAAYTYITPNTVLGGGTADWVSSGSSGNITALRIGTYGIDLWPTGAIGTTTSNRPFTQNAYNLDLTSGANLTIMAPGTIDAPTMRYAKSDVVTSETTASTSFTTLATGDNANGVLVPPSGAIKVSFSGTISNNTAGQFGAMCATVTNASGGGTLFAANDNYGSFATCSGAGATESLAKVFVISGLTPGITVNTSLRYRVSGGTGTFARRNLTVEPCI